MAKKSDHKISRIYIKDYQQFQNFDIDLTYPKGHSKEGLPLDKVCIIGQSGTGKTTLLDLIDKYEVYNEFSAELSIESVKFRKGELHRKITKKEIYLKRNKLKVPRERNLFLEVNPSSTLAKLMWKNIESLYKSYANERSRFIFQIGNAHVNNDAKLVNQLKHDLEQWDAQNENPIQNLSEQFLNPLLKLFGLRVKQEIESLKETEFIQLETIQGIIVPEQKWSTGIQQIVYRTLPLYLHHKEENLLNYVLIDEPENSLYPDTQRKIVEHYLQLAPNAQFFFATHSPIIASCFEPWEIIELKFNEKGEVYRELYYKGENYVENYEFNPQYLNWEDILTRIFDLDASGHEKRSKLLERFAKLEVLLRSKQDEIDENPENRSDDINELINEYRKIGRDLGWKN